MKCFSSLGRTVFAAVLLTEAQEVDLSAIPEAADREIRFREDVL